MIIFYEQSFIQRKDSQDALECRSHLPDLTTMNGVLQTIALANIIEIGLIIYSKTYGQDGVDDMEKLQFVAARRSARRLIAWMDQRLVLTDITSELEKSVQEVQTQWLASQVASLRAHVNGRREDFMDGNKEALAIFNRELDNFVTGKGRSEFKAAVQAADAKSYAYQGEDFRVRDNYADGDTYGKRNKICLRII